MSSLEPGFESKDPRIARDRQEAPAIRLFQQLLFGENRAREEFRALNEVIRGSVLTALALLQQRSDRLRYSEDGIDAAGVTRLQNFLTSVL